MRREQVHQEMKEVLGTAPWVLDRIPDDVVGEEWALLRRTQFDQTLIPTKYRQLIGLAVAAALGSRHWTLFHTEAAHAAGATASEVEEAVRQARLVSGWVTYVNGLQIDFGDFAAQAAELAAYLARNGTEAP